MSGVRELGLAEDFWSQQDNELKHTAHKVKLWLLYNTKNQLHSPPQSPPQSSFGAQDPPSNHNIEGFAKGHTMEEWLNISLSATEKLVQSMPKRMEEAIKRKGYPTSY